MKKVLMMASVASMIDLFNMNNIKILQDIGFEVHVACNFKIGSITSQKRVNDFRKELEQKGVKTFQLPVPRNMLKVNKIVKSYNLMKKICKENKYQIVHCHSPIGGAIARIACIKARKKGTKVIYTAHGFHFFKGSSFKNWLLFFPIEKICARYTDLLITINKEDYVSAEKLSAKEIIYIDGIGVDTKGIKDTFVNRNEKRKEFGISNKDFIFMSIGQVSKRKNHEVIIRALSLLNDKRIKYIIVGFGELEQYLKNLSKEFNVQDQVILAGYRGDVKELLNSADAFAFPSLQEGLPVALMEAMTAGLPIVCSEIRGNTDLIKNGEGGYLYKPNDYKGFADGMKRIASDNFVSEMKYTNQKTMERFDILNINRTMTRVYRNISKGEKISL